MVLSLSILEFTNIRKEDSFSTKERKKSILKGLKHLSYIIALVGWLFLSQDVHAGVTATISGGYLYIPISNGCPEVNVLYARYYPIWRSDDEYYYSYYYSYIDSYYSKPVGTSPSRAPTISHNRENCFGGDYREGDWDTGYRVFYWKSEDYWDWSYYDDSGVPGTKTYYVYVSGEPVVEGSYIKYRVGGSLIQSHTGGYGNDSLTTSSSLPGSISVNSSGSHSFTTTANATCTTAATQRCSRCGVTQSVGSPLGHSWGDWSVLKEATVYEGGSKKHVCTRNSSHSEIVDIPKKNFQIYAGSSRVQKVYQGNALIMNAASGSETLVK